MIPCLLTKDSVKFDRIAPGGFKILAVLQNATFIFDRDLIITCGTEAHGTAGAHPRGEAYDVRTIGMPDATILALVQYLRTNLGPHFTVLYEVPTKPTGVLAGLAYVNTGASAPHLHIQVKKGGTYPPVEVSA